MGLISDAIGTASSVANPYLLYIKIALVVLAFASVIGVCWYVKSVFSERQELIAEKAKLELSLQTEQQKVIVAMEQLRIWQETVAKMNQAIKNIKIQSDTYITGIEDNEKPTFNGNSGIPFIVPTISISKHLSGYANNTTSRASASPTPR